MTMKRMMDVLQQNTLPFSLSRLKHYSPSSALFRMRGGLSKPQHQKACSVVASRFVYRFYCLAVSSLLVADGVGQTAGGDQSDQLDGGDTERHPGHDVAGTVQELGQTAQAAAGEGHADRSCATGAAARLREVDAVVQEATLATAFKARLDRVNQITVHRIVPVFEYALEALLHGGGDVTDEHKHQHGNHDLRNDQQDQEEAVGRGHAVRLANGPAATEEGDDEDDRTEHDQQDGRGDDVVLIADVAQFLEPNQRDGTDDDQRNAA